MIPSTIITFHGIGEPGRPLSQSEQRVWTTQKSFESILDVIAQRKDVHITFDDGNDSDIRWALPALLDRRLAASFFVLAGCLDQPGRLGRGDLRILSAAGMTIGLHGMHHRPWRELPDADLTEELVDARKIIEDAIGQAVVTAACPFGSYGRRCLRRLRQAGYQRIFTSDRGPAEAQSWIQSRNTIHCDDDPASICAIMEQARFGTSLRWIRKFVKRWR